MRSLAGTSNKSLKAECVSQTVLGLMKIVRPENKKVEELILLDERQAGCGIRIHPYV